MKVPGGKLLKTSVEYEGDRVLSVKFSGDFFIHPEDTLDRVEEALRGVKGTDLRKIIEKEVAESTLYGIDAGSMVKIVREAML